MSSPAETRITWISGKNCVFSRAIIKISISIYIYSKLIKVQLLQVFFFYKSLFPSTVSQALWAFHHPFGCIISLIKKCTSRMMKLSFLSFALDTGINPPRSPLGILAPSWDLNLLSKPLIHCFDYRTSSAGKICQWLLFHNHFLC